MLDPVELFPEVPNIYMFPSVHADMVFDKSRVAAYRDAINQTVKEGDVVADLGSGTGLLTFLCLQAGAARVHAIERSEVIEWSKEIAAKNGFSDRIVFHQCDAREAALGEKVDVIVSELMGHVAFEEGMAETISVAKDKYLAPGGISIPQSVSLRAALVNESDIYRNSIDIWDTVEGIDYSSMREKAIRAAYVTEISGKDLLSKPLEMLHWDFTEKPKDIQSQVSFDACRSGEVNGLAVWFEAQMTRAIKLSSSPWTNTHWQQSFIPFCTPVSVKSGSILTANFSLSFRQSDSKEFVFSIEPLG